MELENNLIPPTRSFEETIDKKAKSPEEKAILEACRDVIQETRSKRTPLTYFGILFQSLSQILKEQQNLIATDANTQARVRSSVRMMDVATQLYVLRFLLSDLSHL
jgi:hypothetical protein